MIDYYNVLGVDRTADEQEIKRAYRKLAMKHHPDRGGNPEEFAKIQEAYDMLTNPTAKTQFNSPQPDFDFSGGGFEDIFSHVFGNDGSFGFGPRQQRQQRMQRIQVPIDFKTSLTGGVQHIALAGFRDTIEIQVPNGVDNGDQIRYPRLLQGEDLVVLFRVQPHPEYHRDRLDLYTEISVNVFDLILGHTVMFTTLNDKTIKLNIKAGTQPGTVLRIPHMGVEKEYVKGNLYIKVRARIPDNIDQNVLNTIKANREKNEQ